MINKMIMAVAIIGVLTTISAMIPETSTAGVDNALRSLIGQLYAIDGIIHVSTLVACIQLVIGFYGTMLTFTMFWFLLSKFSGEK